MTLSKQGPSLLCGVVEEVKIASSQITLAGLNCSSATLPQKNRTGVFCCLLVVSITLIRCRMLVATLPNVARCEGRWLSVSEFCWTMKPCGTHVYRMEVIEPLIL